MIHVKKLLTKILTELADEEQATITLPSSYANHGAARNFYARHGRVCELGFDFTPDSTGTQVTLTTLPDTCKPIRATRISAPLLNQSTASTSNYLVTNTDGTVTFTGKDRVFGVVTFICVGGVIRKILHAVSGEEVAA